jgi:hypothetical protein
MKNLIASLFTIFVIATPVFAQTAKEAGECPTYETFTKAHPEAKARKFTQEQFDAFKKVMATNEHASPLPDGVVGTFMVVASNAEDTLILFGTDKDGCLVAHMQIAKDKFAELFGATIHPSSVEKSETPWNGNV